MVKTAESGLQSLLEEIQLIPGRDEVFWELENSGKFTARSLYRLLMFRGVQSVHLKELCNCRALLKVQIFMWMAYHDVPYTIWSPVV